MYTGVLSCLVTEHGPTALFPPQPPHACRPSTVGFATDPRCGARQLLCGVALHGSGASVVAYDSARAAQTRVQDETGGVYIRCLYKYIDAFFLEEEGT